jgi:triacylglycerol esterase/lipase EstA (alpha/beta hydrolase family)
VAKTKMRDIVIILPGIMGSVLQKDNQDLWAVSGQAAWGAVKSLGGSFQQLKLNGDDPNAEYLDGIIPTRLVDDAHIVPGFVKIDGYTQTKRFMIDNFDVVENKCFNIRENKAANFFEFPYDWRRDIRVNAKILKRYIDLRLQQWREFSGAKDAKVILLAHSMGGLVSRYYLEVFEGWRDAKALFTFGTPYRGSPMSLNFLVNGYKNQFMDLTEVVRSLPGAYELLPIYEMLNVDGKDYRIAESPVALPNLNKAMAEDALKFHREIEAAVNIHLNDVEYLRKGYKIVPFVGTDQPTIQSAQFVNGQLKSSRELPTRFDALLVDGDGTVPYISAVPIELSNDFRSTYLVEQHGSLQNHPKVLGELRDRIKASQSQGKEHVRGEIDLIESKPPAIRVTLDDLYLPDETVNMLVQLVNFDRDPGGVTAKISSVSGTTSFERDLQSQGQDWTLELGDLPADFYRVNLRTNSTAPEMPSPVTALFEVVK